MRNVNSLSHSNITLSYLVRIIWAKSSRMGAAGPGAPHMAKSLIPLLAFSLSGLVDATTLRTRGQSVFPYRVHFLNWNAPMEPSYSEYHVFTRPFPKHRDLQPASANAKAHPSANGHEGLTLTRVEFHVFRLDAAFERRLEFVPRRAAFVIRGPRANGRKRTIHRVFGGRFRWSINDLASCSSR